MGQISHRPNRRLDIGLDNPTSTGHSLTGQHQTQQIQPIFFQSPVNSPWDFDETAQTQYSQPQLFTEDNSQVPNTQVPSSHIFTPIGTPSQPFVPNASFRRRYGIDRPTEQLRPSSTLFGSEDDLDIDSDSISVSPEVFEVLCQYFVEGRLSETLVRSSNEYLSQIISQAVEDAFDGIESTLFSKKTKSAETSTSDDMCAICRSDYEEADRQMRLECGHLFHWDCCVDWVKGQPTCPLCRIRLGKKNSCEHHINVEQVNQQLDDPESEDEEQLDESDENHEEDRNDDHEDLDEDHEVHEEDHAEDHHETDEVWQLHIHLLNWSNDVFEETRNRELIFPYFDFLRDNPALF